LVQWRASPAAASEYFCATPVLNHNSLARSDRSVLDPKLFDAEMGGQPPALEQLGHRFAARHDFIAIATGEC
jgi:hypothetical protein